MNIHDDPNDIEYLASMKLQMCQTSDEQFQNSSLPVDCKEMKSE
jgi:hypothetical protein